jgi:hypothetical protein
MSNVNIIAENLINIPRINNIPKINSIQSSINEKVGIIVSGRIS